MDENCCADCGICFDPAYLKLTRSFVFICGDCEENYEEMLTSD